MTISVIAAVAENGVIGKDGMLPWHLPADLKMFKRVTMGHHLVIGRRTWESLGRPLPGREIIVVTRSPDPIDGVRTARSLDEAITLAGEDDEVFIGGGSSIFAEGLQVADRFYLTEIHHSFDGDTHFPAWDRSSWRELRREDHAPGDGADFAWSFVLLQRESGSEQPSGHVARSSGEKAQ